jgi:hypothetical protein
VPDGSQQFPGKRLVGHLGEQLFDGPEAGREVVAVIAVAEERVEPRQRRRVAVDGPTSTEEAGPDPGGVDGSAVRGDIERSG